MNYSKSFLTVIVIGTILISTINSYASEIPDISISLFKRFFQPELDTLRIKEKKALLEILNSTSSNIILPNELNNIIANYAVTNTKDFLQDKGYQATIKYQQKSYWSRIFKCCCCRK